MASEVPRVRNPESHFTEEELNFLVSAPAGVVQILRAAMARSAMVTVYADASGQFAITSILEVLPESDRLIFDLPAQPEVAAALQRTGTATFVTTQDGIKIKFQVGAPSMAIHAGRPALAAALPAEVVRLQRRETFRVACPLARPVRCTIPYTKAGKPEKAELAVLDISQGGVALMNMHPQLTLAPGNVYADCTIAMPDVGVFKTALEVRSAYEVTLRNGQVTMRAGCRFVDPEAGALPMVHKLIMRLERERSGRF